MKDNSKKGENYRLLLILSAVGACLMWFPNVIALILSIIAYTSSKSNTPDGLKLAAKLKPWIKGVLISSIVVLFVLFIIIWYVILNNIDKL